MSDHTFFLDEAQMLLPVLESLLKQAIQGKKLIEDVDSELQSIAQRVKWRNAAERGASSAAQG